MLYHALIFLLVALVAAAFGFGGIAPASAGMAQFLALVFFTLSAITMLIRSMR